MYCLSCVKNCGEDCSMSLLICMNIHLVTLVHFEEVKQARVKMADEAFGEYACERL